MLWKPVGCCCAITGRANDAARAAAATIRLIMEVPPGWVGREGEWWDNYTAKGSTPLASIAVASWGACAGRWLACAERSGETCAMRWSCVLLLSFLCAAACAQDVHVGVSPDVKT